jgi:hypothetical protein
MSGVSTVQQSCVIRTCRAFFVCSISNTLVCRPAHLPSLTLWLLFINLLHIFSQTTKTSVNMWWSLSVELFRCIASTLSVSVRSSGRHVLRTYAYTACSSVYTNAYLASQSITFPFVFDIRKQMEWVAWGWNRYRGWFCWEGLGVSISKVSSTSEKEEVAKNRYDKP